MRSYKIKFTGRKRGAIGIFERFSVIVTAESEEKAVFALYDDFEHLSGVKVSLAGN